jgi:hypothetical protein
MHIAPQLQLDIRACFYNAKNNEKQAGAELCQAQVKLGWPANPFSQRFKLFMSLNPIQVGRGGGNHLRPTSVLDTGTYNL